MKIISPFLALATLASSTSAAINKDKTRTKKRTTFHEVDVQRDGTTKSPLDNAKAARRQRHQQSGMGKMEKVTKVKMEHIVNHGRSMHSIFKKKEGDASPADDGSSASAEQETPPDQAIPSEPSVATEERPTTATATFLRSTTGDANAIESEEWEAHTAAPATAPNVQELMQKRRRDRAHDFELKKTGQNEAILDQKYGRGTAKASILDEKYGRRIASTPESPNPRPGRRNKVSTSGKNEPSGKNQQDPGFDKRDLKKSKKSSNSSGSKSGKSGSSENQCVVRLTNLTKEQWFSDIFWMVHSDKVKRPLWSFGRPASSDLASLAQNGDADDLIDFYEDNDDGVLDVDSERGPIEEGESTSFVIPKSGSYDLFTMATSFIFSNDGFVSIDAGEIKDGATWFLWGLDAGVEANSQLCWTVQATSDEFPLNSECSDVKASSADENDNNFPGEGFVHVHNGIHDFQDKNDLDDFLDFTCDDLEADDFFEYFSALGYDDDKLLYDDDRGKNERDDESFLDNLEDEDDFFGDIIVFRLALNAGDFKTFCDDLEDINKDVTDAFATLEPQIFDFRTPMLRVQMAC
mmetsp:Transcript_30666/g.56734  ORF Transcript_30666/g.56734 Transcript_30666/m.56734 type:complete len:578 (-) Transcript_30666:125-1858(-)|eukprot:CAMPEP_0201870340 /NCGR_PEP_ID=MMETSP0902-20130614/3469_1 /ASSEMBLY_ACC=CAM_ASM_000551 /TAXON_ID=420261 /ORGANISM="Thalassiosira antarctica, Strain CCMP982" /LENGTH=577 /DNA_ID=CAMNT_0048395931 /DNA_START=40 /DNA_END=1773 /DNA_ORIENTATION=+